jgi:superfamily I DNA and/or RNA helicase
MRRLNVAITRARRGLIVIGDETTLRRDKNWRAWLDWIAESGLMAWHMVR